MESEELAEEEEQATEYVPVGYIELDAKASVFEEVEKVVGLHKPQPSVEADADIDVHHVQEQQLVEQEQEVYDLYLYHGLE